MKIDYNIFRPGNLENWEASLSGFQKLLERVEDNSKNVLDKCIPQLKSSEQGIMFINNIDKIKTRPTLVVYMQMKQINVIEKFIVEIEYVEMVFLVS